MRLESRFQIAPNWPYIETMTSTSQLTNIIFYSEFLGLIFFLVKLSYWVKFYINIITSSEVMTMFFYKGLIWNPEIRNTSVWVFPNVWRLGTLGIPNQRTNISNEMLPKAAKCQGYSFYGFWIIKRKFLHPPPPSLPSLTPPHRLV